MPQISTLIFVDKINSSIGKNRMVCFDIFISFSIKPIFLSLELVEFVGKCILEEIFQWIECKEVENLAFKDVNVDQLSDVLSTSTEDLINKGFTIFQAVHDFYKGTIYILRKHLYTYISHYNPRFVSFLPTF